MKTVLLILFSAIALPALSELTAADFNKIRLIVKEPETAVKSDIEKINSKIDEIDTRLRTVEIGVAELRGRNIGFSVPKDWLVAICAVAAITISIISLRKAKHKPLFHRPHRTPKRQSLNKTDRTYALPLLARFQTSPAVYGSSYS